MRARDHIHTVVFTVVAARGQPARRNAIAGTMDEDADRSALS